MKEGPEIARIAALIGDPARANILTALMGGEALTATELAREAGVTRQTASSHLKKLRETGLVRPREQGRHRYFQIRDADVAGLLESMMGLAANRGLLRTRPGPRDDALRKARVCYDHLAGDYGVMLFDALSDRRYIFGGPGDVRLTARGRTFLNWFGIDIPEGAGARTALCKPCLDWSVRHSHLAGPLAAAFLQRFYELGWAARRPQSRVVTFNDHGDTVFTTLFDERNDYGRDGKNPRMTSAFMV